MATSPIIGSLTDRLNEMITAAVTGFFSPHEVDEPLTKHPACAGRSRLALDASPGERAAVDVVLGEHALPEKGTAFMERNDAEFIYPTDACAHQLFEAQAERRPEAVALVFGDRKLTYGQLNAQANQLAHYLISLGVGPEALIGLCLDRSLEGVVSALGVLKAGGAYLPLDPTYPVERLAFMLSDAQPRVLITREDIAAQLPPGAWQVVVPGESQIEGYSTRSPANSVAPEHLAYVIYTSGSTGRPKGVEITHKSLTNLVTWHQRAFDVSPHDKASLLAGVGFDAAVWETWPYLAAGASLHLPDEITRLSPELLRDWLVHNEVTISFLPTALAERAMSLSWPSNTALRLMLTGADTLHLRPSSTLPFMLINNYGPTECTVVATSGSVLPSDDPSGLPAIGRPISNIQVYILNEDLQQAPTGTVGELHIGGVGLARGYLNQSALTEEKFIADPFSGEPGARLYKTGDLARYLDDGEIAYLGRIDDQVKMMGYRIEPNEIVAVLDRHPAILTSVVVAREDAHRDKHLVAYLVLDPESRTTPAELRSFVQRELPDYMAPAIFVHLKTLPLTQNGKVDRAALPIPNAENTLCDEGLTEPLTPVEGRLADMLPALLGLAEVSVSDNFFLLGGHSLLGTQLIGQIRNEFDVDLALRSVFDAPTIAELALEVERLILAKVAGMSEDEVQRQLLA